MNKRSVAFLSSLLVGMGAAQAQPQPTVVELFSSEGCSSCPPAEALIGVLAQRRPDVIALAFHVDYWDYIGWRDRFEIREAPERQERYATALRLRSIYTPQLIIDGRRDVIGGADATMVPRSGATQSFALDIQLRADEVNVSLGAAQTAPPCDVMLVSYLPEASSAINAGENAGRELHEFNVVRSISRLGAWSGRAASFRVAIASLPADATRVAVLIQTAGQGPIVGAATYRLR